MPTFFPQKKLFTFFVLDTPFWLNLGFAMKQGPKIVRKKKREAFFKKSGRITNWLLFHPGKNRKGKRRYVGEKYLFKHQLAPLKRRRREKKPWRKKKKTWFISIQLGDHHPRFRNFFWGQFRASRTGRGGGGRGGGLRILFTPFAGWRQVFLCERDLHIYCRGGGGERRKKGAKTNRKGKKNRIPPTFVYRIPLSQDRL